MDTKANNWEAKDSKQKTKKKNKQTAYEIG